MQIAVTGATGFLGRYLVAELAQRHDLRCWRRPTSDCGGFESVEHCLQWGVGG